MRILMVARRYPPDVRSGTETVFAALYAEARKRHDVRLVVGYRTGRENVPPEAVAVDLRDRGASGYVAMGLAAAREARGFKPDVVLSNSVEIAVPGVPNALIVHDLNFGKAARDAGTVLREQLYKAQGRRLESVITVSEASRRQLLRIGVPDAKITVIPNGVDIARFVPREPRPAAPIAPAGMKLPALPPVRFVYPGRILPGKGQHAAIDALGRMRPDQKYRAHLTIVGAVADRIYFDKLKIQAFQQPVTFAPDVDDIVPYYQDAEVVLFPTLMEEGFGFTAVEGMACGKPVVYYDQPAIREATGGIGIPVPRDDPDALRNVMLRLVADPEERARLGREGRAYVETRAWDRVWGRYEVVLEGIRRR
ncbi:MAG: glycosyltransferase family 4 protein [Myxococcota bacterium]